MEITKEKVLERAKELSLTLTEEEVEQFVKDGKLPEKEKEKLDDISLAEAIKIIKEMRDENAKRRLNEKKLQDKLDEVAKTKEKEKKEALEEQGKYKELYEETLKKVNEYEPRVNEYNEYQNTKRETLRNKLGDKWIDSFSSIPLKELEVLADKLTDHKAGTGSGNHKGDPPKPEPKNDGFVVEYKSIK